MIKTNDNDSLWNDRHMTFTGDGSKDILWKDLKTDDWLKLYELTTQYISSFQNLTIDNETKLLKQILYKHKNQMRRDIPYQYIKKVETLSSRFVKVDVPSLLKKLHKLLHNIKDINRTSFACTVTVPSEEFLRFIMLKSMGACHLASVIVEKCEAAARYLYGHLSYGFFVSFNTFAIATVSKLWCLYKEISLMLSKFVELFNESICIVYPNMSDFIKSMTSTFFEKRKSMSSSKPISKIKPLNSSSQSNDKGKSSESNRSLENGRHLENSNNDFGEVISVEEALKLRNKNEEDNKEKDRLALLHPKSPFQQENRGHVIKTKCYRCSFCNCVATHASFLHRPIATPLHKKTFSFRRNNKMYLFDVIHKLCHATFDTHTRLLLFRYKHLRKMKRRRSVRNSISVVSKPK